MRKFIAVMVLGMIATTAMAEGGSDRLIERQQSHQQSATK